MDFPFYFHEAFVFDRKSTYIQIIISHENEKYYVQVHF